MFVQVNGKSYKKFAENQNKILKTWMFPLDGSYSRVVLEKGTLDVWVNGKKLDTAVSYVKAFLFHYTVQYIVLQHLQPV